MFFALPETYNYDRNPEEVRTVRQWKPVGIYSAVVDLKNVHAGTTTNSTFVCPKVGESVTIPVSSTTNLRVGDHLSVGALVGYYRTGTVSTNPVSFTSYRRGSYVTATVLGSGLFVVGPSSWTTTTGSFSVPETYNNAVGTANVATIANVPSNAVVAISSRAGTFLITAVGTGNVTAVMVGSGEIPAGATVPSGVEVASGVLLGITKNDTTTDFAGACWAPYDFWQVSLATTSGGSPSGATINFGPFGNTASGVTRFSQWCDAQAITTSATVTAGNYRQVSLRAQHGERLSAPRNHPIMLSVTTASTSSVYTASFVVRGFYSE